MRIPDRHGLKRHLRVALITYSVIALLLELATWFGRTGRGNETVFGVVFVFAMSFMLAGTFPALLAEHMEKAAPQAGTVKLRRPTRLAFGSLVVLTGSYFSLHALAAFLNTYSGSAVIFWLSSDLVLWVFAAEVTLLSWGWFYRFR